jgi:Tfp pilus assembly protein PilO
MPANSQKSPRQRGSWLVTIALAVAAGVYMFYSFIPTAAAIRQQREEIRTRQEFITQSTYMPQILADTQKQIDRANEYSARWHARLATPSRLPALLGRITKQADLAGTSTTRFEPQVAHQLEQLRDVPITFGTRGSFAQVGGMLARLEQMPDLIWVDEMRLSEAREDSENVQCELRLIVFAGNSEKSD